MLTYRGRVRFGQKSTGADRLTQMLLDAAVECGGYEGLSQRTMPHTRHKKIVNHSRLTGFGKSILVFKEG